MIFQKKLGGAIGIATMGNLVGRSANVFIPFTVISLFGANSPTDLFFLTLAIAFFFFGTLANAITDASIPLIISGRLVISKSTILGVGLTGSVLMLCISVATHLVWHALPWSSIFALSLMAGAGVANGLAAAWLNVRERFGIPGITWSLRLFPLAVFLIADASAEALGILAIGIGLADVARLLLMLGVAGIPSQTDRPAGFTSLVSTFPAYGVVLGAAAIMGLNPLVDRLIAQLSGPGAISVLEAADRIYGILASLCTIGMSSVLLTQLSKAANNTLALRLWRNILQMVTAFSAIWMVIGIGIGWWGLPFFLDMFTDLSISQSTAVRHAYWFYLAGLPIIVWVLAYIKKLQAEQRWWVMLVCAIIGVGLNIPASLLLRNWLGVAGIALATSLVYMIILIILAVISNLDRNTNPSAQYA